MKFKLHFPSGYNEENLSNGNIDVNIIVGSKVFFVTLFTINSINHLMLRDGFFWSTDAITIPDLHLETISDALSALIDEGYLEEATTHIGDINSVFGKSNIS